MVIRRKVNEQAWSGGLDNAGIYKRERKREREVGGLC